MNRSSHLKTSYLLSTLAVWVAMLGGRNLQAQATSARQSGTVTATATGVLTIQNAAGTKVTVTLAPDATVVQIPPGSTDLKAGQPAKLSDIAVGDRVVTGKAGDTESASRVILMKSSDIAARNETEKADWQRRGTGGLVKAVDGWVITVSAATHTIKVDTDTKTIFRRYAGDSVNFADAKPGTFADIEPGDQLSVRGEKSEDGLTIKAEEVVSGTFSNLSGALTGVNPTAGTVTLKDLISKKTVTVAVTSNSDLRKLPPEAATAFAARTRAGGGPAGGAGAGNRGAVGGAAPPRPAGAPAAAAGGARSAGLDLSRLLSRLPTITVSDLHPGDAIMLVASPGKLPDVFTAITLLSGVEPLLSSSAGGSQPITLSPWTLGAPEGGGGGPQ